MVLKSLIGGGDSKSPSLAAKSKDMNGLILDQDLLSDPSPGLAPVFRVVGTIIHSVESLEMDRARACRLASRIQAIALDLNASAAATPTPTPTSALGLSLPSSDHAQAQDPFSSIQQQAPSPRRSPSSLSLSNPASPNPPTSATTGAVPPPPPTSAAASPSKRSSIYGAVVDYMSRGAPPPSPETAARPNSPLPNEAQGSPLSQPLSTPPPPTGTSETGSAYSLVRRWRSPSNSVPANMLPIGSSPPASPISPSISSFFFSSYKSLGFGSSQQVQAPPLQDHRKPETFLVLAEAVKGFLIAASKRDWIRCVLCRSRFEEKLASLQIQVRSWAEDVGFRIKDLENWKRQDEEDIEKDRKWLETKLKGMIASVTGRRSPDSEAKKRQRSLTSGSNSTYNSSYSGGDDTDDESFDVLPLLKLDSSILGDAERFLMQWLEKADIADAFGASTDAVFAMASPSDSHSTETSDLTALGDSAITAAEESTLAALEGKKLPASAEPTSTSALSSLPFTSASIERQWIELVLDALRRENRGLQASSLLSEQGKPADITVINPYDLDDDGDGLPLAQAGFGETRRAVLHGMPPVSVVVKKLRTPVKDPILREKLIEELKTWSQIDSNYVVKIVGASPNSELPIIVTPFFRNGDLLTYTRSHPGHSLRLLHETALGMAYLHSIGIVHGSLRASNVLVSDKGAGVITDFGTWDLRMEAAFGTGTSASATKSMFPMFGFTGNKPLNHVRAGWKRWMAPEVLRGGAIRNPVDVYAFAMTCYELVSGGAPFQGMITNAGYNDFVADNEEEEEIERRVLYDGERPKRPTLSSSNANLSGSGNPPTGGCPDLLWDLLTNCWAQEPLERPEFSAVESRLKTLLRMQSAWRRQSQIKSRSEAFVIHVPLDDLTPPSLLSGGGTGPRPRNISFSSGSVGSSRSGGSGFSGRILDDQSVAEPGVVVGNKPADEALGLERKRTVSSTSDRVDSAYDKSPRTSMISLNLALSLDGIVGPPHPSTTLKFGIDLPPREERDDTSIDELSADTSEVDESSRDPSTWNLWLLLLSDEERAKGLDAPTSIPWHSFAAALRNRLPTLLASPSLKRIVDPSNTNRVTHRAVSALISTASQPSSSAPSHLTLLDTAFARFCMTPNATVDPSSVVLDVPRIREVITSRDPTVASAPDSLTNLIHLTAKMAPGTADDILDLLLDSRVIPSVSDSIVATDGKGWTALHHAAKAAASRATNATKTPSSESLVNSAKIGKRLICNCRELSKSSNGEISTCGCCPVSRLIESGSDVHAATPRTLWTALHVAAWNGAYGAVCRLLVSKADPWTRDSQNWTPLLHAARYNHPNVVKELLSAMAECEPATAGEKPSPLFNEKAKALAVAQSQGHAEVIDLLVL
ncbi:hypothetical protein HDU97_004480 [Phlyctochytrium planicorne]|nr:hypothetical protein HDU97_004480 [Phlyctochytrium planicorne]